MDWSKSLGRHWVSLVVVDDFYIVRVSACPPETDAPPVIDADAVLAGPIACQFLEAVGGWNAEVKEIGGGVEHDELPERNSLEVRRQPTDPLSLEEAFGIEVPEAANHAQ
jgi:hypothetical protein